jgi:3-methyladenine DNA glycosylase/8-oxoguanine DNA glycosylase
MPKKLDHSAACEHLSRVDRQLARIMARSGPCRLQQETTQSIFAALLESIIYQQLNGKVAATITARVKALFPENTKRIRTRRGLVDGFPTPEQILAASEERLRSAGLSRAKMLAIRDLAAKTIDGTVPTVKQAHRMSDEELIERLDTVRGIGRWTVEMLLIFRLGRPDVLPVDDYGVRKGFAKMRKLAELPMPKELLAYGERWRPYRSVASWYLWRSAEMKDLPLAASANGKQKTAAQTKGTKARRKNAIPVPSKRNSTGKKRGGTKG